MAQTFLVTSATGAQGGATIRELLHHGARIHALVRDASSPASLALANLGVQLFEGDFFNLEAINAALVGVTGIFLNTFPSFATGKEETVQAQNIVNAANAAGTIRTIVASTAFKASEQAALAVSRPGFNIMPFYYAHKTGVEDVVKTAGLENWTVLRPAVLNYNYLAPVCDVHFPEYRGERILSVSYARDFKQLHFDPVDVGKFAAAALLEPECFRGRVLELAREPLTFEEIAERVSRVSGVHVTARFRTEEETTEVIESGKLPAFEAQLWARGDKWEEDPKALDEYGFKLGTLEEYLEREKERLLDTLGVKEE